MSGLFIGLVTHPLSQFPGSRGSHGLMGQLADELSALGMEISTYCEDRDLADSIEELTAQELAHSRDYLLQVQRDWASYISHDSKSLRLHQWVARMRRAVEPQSSRAARRLLNIELAHLEIMTASLATGADFTLIIEDDAHCPDIQALAGDLHDLMMRTEAPYMSHVSTSFSPEQLGIDSLVSGEESRWSNGGHEFRLLRPVTNTVCATMYRQDFLLNLHQRWRAEKLVPVIPVDWRLNALLMDMYATGDLPKGYATVVFPSPIIQRSLHS
ncbi:MAG: hypothetical protein GKR85_07380 [Candidatus Nanopelagicales bacterium]|nr:hypothetical protein [Candidatus Nanopelagicales bacterium]